MKIAVLHDESAYAASEFEHLTARLSGHQLVTWRSGEPPPANDFQMLLGVGKIDRTLLEGQPQLELVQATSAGYERVDVEAASTLGIWVLLLMASSRDLGLALQSERDPGIKLERPAQALSGKNVCIVGFGGIGRELVAGAILVNIARGTLVDEPALNAALESGRMRAVGLDVLRNEPPSISDPLVAAPHSFVTPHMAGGTDVSIEGTTRYVGTVIDAFEKSRRWNSLLNDPSRPRRPLHAYAAAAQPAIR